MTHFQGTLWKIHMLYLRKSCFLRLLNIFFFQNVGYYKKGCHGLPYVYLITLNVYMYFPKSRQRHVPAMRPLWEMGSLKKYKKTYGMMCGEFIWAFFQFTKINHCCHYVLINKICKYLLAI